MSKPLSFTSLTNPLASVLDAQYDPRQPGKSRYALSDAGLAAFSVFFGFGKNLRLLLLD